MRQLRRRRDCSGCVVRHDSADADVCALRRYRKDDTRASVADGAATARSSRRQGTLVRQDWRSVWLTSAVTGLRPHRSNDDHQTCRRKSG